MELSAISYQPSAVSHVFSLTAWQRLRRRVHASVDRRSRSRLGARGLSHRATDAPRLVPCPPNKVPMDICGGGNLQVDERFHKTPNQAVTGLEHSERLKCLACGHPR